MLQLVKKDFFIHKKIILAMLAVLIVYMLIEIPPIFLGVLFAFTMSLHIFSSDEKPHTKVLLSSLPFTRKEIVSAKYIAALLYTLVIVVILVAGTIIINQQQPDWTLISFVVVSSLCIVTIAYPVCYQFESKYLMFVFVIGFAIYLLVGNLFVKNLHEYINQFIVDAMNFMQGENLWLVCLVALILYIASWFVSVKIYERKEF